MEILRTIDYYRSHFTNLFNIYKRITQTTFDYETTMGAMLKPRFLHRLFGTEDPSSGTAYHNKVSPHLFNRCSRQTPQRNPFIMPVLIPCLPLHQFHRCFSIQPEPEKESVPHASQSCSRDNGAEGTCHVTLFRVVEEGAVGSLHVDPVQLSQPVTWRVLLVKDDVP